MTEVRPLLSSIKSMPDFAHELLRREIIAGVLAPGEPLKQAHIASRLGLSLAPIREALQRLESEGLVVSHRHRGYFVSSLDLAEIDDIFEMRIWIEGRTSYHSTERRTEEDVVRIDTLLSEMEACSHGPKPDLGRWGGVESRIPPRAFSDQRTQSAMGFCTDQEARRFLEMVPLVERAVVESGVAPIKYWLEVSQEEQARRLEARIHDGRKIWKLSPMDLKSYSRWFDYSRAKDEMFQATDTAWAPWYVVQSDDKRRARLNIIAHILKLIAYREIAREKVKLPKQQKRGDYREPNYQFKHVPAVY